MYIFVLYCKYIQPFYLFIKHIEYKNLLSKIKMMETNMHLFHYLYHVLASCIEYSIDLLSSSMVYLLSSSYGLEPSMFLSVYSCYFHYCFITDDYFVVFLTILIKYHFYNICHNCHISIFFLNNWSYWFWFCYQFGVRFLFHHFYFHHC